MIMVFLASQGYILITPTSHHKAFFSDKTCLTTNSKRYLYEIIVGFVAARISWQNLNGLKQG